MIERCNYSDEMWARKCEMDLKLNNMFLKQDFRNFIVEKTHYCPRDLNIDTVFEDDGKLALLCCMKHYGYESTANNDDAFSDLGDYETEYFKGSTGDKYWPLMCQYIEMNDTELFSALMELDCVIYW